MTLERIISNIKMWRANLPNLRKESPAYICATCIARSSWLESMEEICIYEQDVPGRSQLAGIALIQVHINVGEVRSLYHEFKCS